MCFSSLRLRCCYLLAFVGRHDDDDVRCQQEIWKRSQKKSVKRVLFSKIFAKTVYQVLKLIWWTIAILTLVRKFHHSRNSWLGCDVWRSQADAKPNDLVMGRLKSDIILDTSVSEFWTDSSQTSIPLRRVVFKKTSDRRIDACSTNRVRGLPSTQLKFVVSWACTAVACFRSVLF